MKQITNKTILKQGDKTFQPIEVDGIIYWIGKDLVGINSKTIKNYCPNSNQIFVGYFESNDDELYQGVGKVHPKEIIAQSSNKLEGVPIINLDEYLEKISFDYYISNDAYTISDSFHFSNGYKANPNQYTQKDIEKAIDLARKDYINNDIDIKHSSEILKQINSISIIEVNENWEVISYE
jgi:L-rhamnose isomerase